MDKETFMPEKKQKTKQHSNSKKSNTKDGKIKELQKQLSKFQKELHEKNDKLMRSYADFDNYKKRVRKQEEQLICDQKKKYLSELIDLRELLIQALNDDHPNDGIRLLIKQLDQFFENERVVTIECVGKRFDHTNHHAVTMVEKDDCEDQTIVEEIKKGYKVDDMILRPSQVIVSKKK